MRLRPHVLRIAPARELPCSLGLRVATDLLRLLMQCHFRVWLIRASAHHLLLLALQSLPIHLLLLHGALHEDIRRRLVITLRSNFSLLLVDPIVDLFELRYLLRINPVRLLVNDGSITSSFVAP